MKGMREYKIERAQVIPMIQGGIGIMIVISEF